MMPIEEAYQKFWSYVEDKKLWDLEDLPDDECRALLPAWNNVLLRLAGMLNADKAKEFVNIASRGYISAEKRITDEDYNNYYNPFFDDLYFISEFIGNSKSIGEDFKEIIALFERRFSDGFVYEIQKTTQALDKIGNDRMRNDNYNLIKQNREGITETLNNAGSEVAVKNVIEHTPTIIKETIKRALADFYFFDPEDLDYSLLTVVSRLTTDNEIVSKETVKLFIDYIFNPSNPYRESAIEALGEIGSEEAVKPLLDYISNPANPGRAQALDSLVEIGNKGAVKPFIDYLSNPSNPGIQWALIALGKIESEETVNPSILIECMSNLNNSRRKRVINTLTDKGNKGGIKILKTLLHDYWSYNEDMYDAIHSIHQRLKPQGYIAPQTKELAA